jgi:pimeloyl-ACP methyl ester carboxylesterase
VDRGIYHGAAAAVNAGCLARCYAPAAMVLRLFRAAKGAALWLRGARAVRVNAGPAELLVYRFGPRGSEPWVLLHGLASTALAWQAVLPTLGRDCRVLVPELSALGGSDVPGDGLAVADGVATVVALIEGEFGGRPVTLAGNSLGAWIAVRLALQRPDLVDRLVLVAAAGYRDQDWERIRELITIRDTADVTALLPALFARVPVALHLARRAFRTAYGSPAVTSALAKLEARDAFGDEELARIEVPTALIWGEEDGLFHLETARRMAAALPQATLYPLPGCAHALHWEQPQALVEAIETFRRASRLEARRSDAA